MITSNLWTSAGIVNGATGVMKDILWESEITNFRGTMPSVIMVTFDNLEIKTPFQSINDSDDKNWVPIPSVIYKWGEGTNLCSRRQFPIRLSYCNDFTYDS